MHTASDVPAGQLRLSDRAAVAVGLGLATSIIGPALLLSKLAGFQFLAVQLGFIGAVYFGFAVADGRLTAIAVELGVASLFLMAGAISLWADSPLVLVGGYVAHGLWDLLHHPRAVSTTPVRSWYPPFCVVFDWALAVFIALWLPLGGVA